MARNLSDGTVIEHDLNSINDLLMSGWYLFQVSIAPNSFFTAQHTEMKQNTVFFRLSRDGIIPSGASWEELYGRSLYKSFTSVKTINLYARSIRETTDTNTVKNLEKRGYRLVAQGRRVLGVEVVDYFVLAEL